MFNCCFNLAANATSFQFLSRSWVDFDRGIKGAGRLEKGNIHGAAWILHFNRSEPPLFRNPFPYFTELTDVVTFWRGGGKQATNSREITRGNNIECKNARACVCRDRLTGSQLKRGVDRESTPRQFETDFSREKERVCINYADLIKARKAAN